MDKKESEFSSHDPEKEERHNDGEDSNRTDNENNPNLSSRPTISISIDEDEGAALPESHSTASGFAPSTSIDQNSSTEMPLLLVRQESQDVMLTTCLTSDEQASLPSEPHSSPSVSSQSIHTERESVADLEPQISDPFLSVREDRNEREILSPSHFSQSRSPPIQTSSPMSNKKISPSDSRTNVSKNLCSSFSLEGRTEVETKKLNLSLSNPESAEIREDTRAAEPVCEIFYGPSTSTGIRAWGNSSKSHKPRKFKCDICGRIFHSKPIIRVHMRVHTGEKPHFCNVCGRTFGLKCNHKRHMSTHKKKDIQECKWKEIKINPLLKKNYYECPFCSKVFKYLSLKIYHIKSKHSCDSELRKFRKEKENK